MSEIFPKPILDLPEADIPIHWAKIYKGYSNITYFNQKARYKKK
ncbi:MAG: hypothetical protein ACFE9Q_17215 [Candidatus Hodarchaeota archaeon]